jgi:hypothetical protein
MLVVVVDDIIKYDDNFQLIKDLFKENNRTTTNIVLRTVDPN